MGKNTRFVGLDVHAETIAVAVAEGRNRVRSLGTITNRPEAVRRAASGEAGEVNRAQSLLRSRPHRVRALLGADAAGRAVRGDRAIAGAHEIR